MDDILGKILPSYRETKLNRQIASYRKSGHTLAAGKLLEDAGRLPEATDAYLEGQEFFAAATTLEKMGKLEKAADYYLQSGDYKKAANVYIAAKKPAKAAQLFLEKGNSLEAARLFGVADQWDKAAELYNKGGYPLRAAEAYQKKEEWGKAAECYEKHFMENVSFSTQYSSTAPSVDQKSALQAGHSTSARASRPRPCRSTPAATISRKRPTSACARANTRRRRSCTCARKDNGLAADAYEKGGERVKAANLRGEGRAQEREDPGGGAAFLEGQDYQRSAELFEQVGMLPDARAPTKRPRAGRPRAASTSAPATRTSPRSATSGRASWRRRPSSTRSRDSPSAPSPSSRRRASPSRAARRRRRREIATARSRCCSASPRTTRTSAALPRSWPACSWSPGRAPLAIDRLQRAIAGQPVSIANIDLIYWLAVAQEKDQPAEALALYKKIQAEHLGFKDVDDRVAALEAGKPIGFVPRPVTPPPPAGRGAADGEAVDRRAASARPGAVARRPRTRAPPRPPLLRPLRGAGRSGRGRPRSRREQGPKAGSSRTRRSDAAGWARSSGREDLPTAATWPCACCPAPSSPATACSARSPPTSRPRPRSHTPNGVKVLGFVEHEGNRCVVTEFVQGRHLGDALKTGHKMSVQQAHGLGRVVAQYLSFIHGKGLVHGSIQPSNIMVASGVLKVADMGLGRLAHNVPSDVDYRAPEGLLDVAGDLYAMSGRALPRPHRRASQEAGPGRGHAPAQHLQQRGAGGAGQAADPRPAPARRAALRVRGRGPGRAEANGPARVKRA
jgi:tetratricopeptide (TPR) repeat protein